MVDRIFFSKKSNSPLNHNQNNGWQVFFTQKCYFSLNSNQIHCFYKYFKTQHPHCQWSHSALICFIIFWVVVWLCFWIGTQLFFFFFGNKQSRTNPLCLVITTFGINTFMKNNHKIQVRADHTQNYFLLHF